MNKILIPVMLMAASIFAISSVSVTNTQAQNATSTELGENASDIAQSILDKTQKVADDIGKEANLTLEKMGESGTDTDDSNIPGDSKVVLLSKKFNEGGKYGYDKILGQVKNIGNDTPTSIEIGATIYDKNGDVIATKTGYPKADNLKPGQKSTFDITFLSFEDIDEMESYELSLQWPDPGYNSVEQYIENANVTKN